MVATEVGVLSPEEMSKVAKEEVNEDPERVEADINAIKEWLAKQPHLQGTRSGKWDFFLNSIVNVNNENMLVKLFSPENDPCLRHCCR